MRLNHMCSVAALVMLCSGPALGAEWWHGSFVLEESTSPCGENDSIATFSDKTVERWELSCTITKKTPLTKLKAIILDLSCSGDDEEVEVRRELLLDDENGGLISYPSLAHMRSCTAPVKQTASTCGVNNRVYRSEPRPGAEANYQELRLLDGMPSGTAKLTQYTDGKAQWTATGEFGCSNGASVCSMSFKTMSGEEVNQPYELVRNGSDNEHTLVIPSLAQSTYYASRSGEEKGYAGLVADLLGGYTPEKNELLLPANVYNFSHCAPN